MSRVAADMARTSFPAMSGAAMMAQRLKWARYSSSVMPPFPTSSMSGSFHAPARAPLAGVGSRVGVDAEPQSPGVDVIRQRLDAVGKAGRVGDERAGGIARDLPAVVDHHVAVAGVAHPAGHDGVRGLLDQLLAHVAAEMVPAVPAHGGRTRQPVVEGGPGGPGGTARTRRHDRDDEQRGEQWLGETRVHATFSWYRER